MDRAVGLAESEKSEGGHSPNRQQFTAMYEKDQANPGESQPCSDFNEGRRRSVSARSNSIIGTKSKQSNIKPPIQQSKTSYRGGAAKQKQSSTNEDINNSQKSKVSKEMTQTPFLRRRPT